MIQKPSNAFIGASWVALLAGAVSYCVGLWNAQFDLALKAYYFTLLMYGLFSAVSLQKAVRDLLEGIRVTALYYGISWFSTGLSVLLLIIGLWNTHMAYSEKGFYGMAFTLAVFSAVAVQKNVRDTQYAEMLNARMASPEGTSERSEN